MDPSVLFVDNEDIEEKEVEIAEDDTELAVTHEDARQGEIEDPEVIRLSEVPQHE